jgi:hypothetical protein
MKSIYIIALTALVAGCAPKPMISNFHKGTYKYGTAPKDLLRVSVDMLPIPKSEAEKEKPKMAWDLRDSIPHTLIKTLGAKDKAEEFMKLMAAQIQLPEKKEPPTFPTDYTQHKVLFSFSNTKRYFANQAFMHPNTRLEFLNIFLALPANSNFSFYNIDKLINEYEEIDLGTLERNESVTLNAKLSGQGDIGSTLESTTGNTFQDNQGNKAAVEIPVYDAKGNVVGKVNSSGEFTSSANRISGTKATSGAKATAAAEASYQNIQSIKEAINVKLKRMKTGFSFSSKEFVIAQRGRVGGDISDNVYVTATLKITSTTGVNSKDVFNFTNTFGPTGEATAADNLAFSMRNVNYILCNAANAVTFTTKYEGAIRAVGNTDKKTGENSMEYDDDVTYYKIDLTDGNGLTIDQNVFCKKVFKIVAFDAAGNEYTLFIASPSSKELDLFSDDNPHLMLQWIIDAVTSPAKAFLSTKKFRMYFEKNSDGSKIFLVKDAVTDAEFNSIKTLFKVQAVERTN